MMNNPEQRPYHNVQIIFMDMESVSGDIKDSLVHNVEIGDRKLVEPTIPA